jgi:hypothetical protein
MVATKAMEDSTSLSTASFNHTPKNLSLVKVITNNIGVSTMAELKNTEVCWKDICSQYCAVNSKKLPIFTCFTTQKIGIHQQTI